ncbi:response regulator [Gorillibacterium sp. sgz5001074]|uniref:response regulator transcription factor n=1 Tax=Gorillibacterium sp. sgz5001074 TaxID=3446695 RepID=UPI003F66E808
MYKVLLVDDEPAIRAGLRTIVNWAAHGFAVAGDAANGRDAVAKHAQLEPDLIVIDIRMPGMDGLTAIGEIRKTDVRCHILILSGYADFTYARQAIVQGVDGYILKPLDEEELEKELVRVRALLDREQTVKHQAVRETAVRRDEWIGRLLSSEAAVMAEAEAELLPLLGPAARMYQVILLELGREEASVPGRHAAVRKRWAELLEETGAGCLFTAEPYVGLLLKEDVRQPAIRREVNARLREGAGEVRYIAAAGEPVRQLADLRRSYDGALRLMKRSFLMEGCDIMVEELCGAGNRAISGNGKPAADTPPDLESLAQQLYYAVDIGSREGVADTLRRAGDQITAFDCSEASVKKSFAHLLTLALNKLSAAHGPEAVQDAMPLIPELYRQPFYGALLELVQGRMAELLFRLGNRSSGTVMKQLLDFIQRHHGENLKLETLADLFKYNSSYLGKLFKQHTGESFNTYLDKVRIRRAIELLGEGLKVHQVSDRVGYANVDYFHSKFKKYVGTSPSSFKGSRAKAPQAPVRED